MIGTTDSYPGVTLADLPRPGWIPLHLAPFRYALDLDPEPDTLDLTAFEPGEVLEAASVTSKVNWSTGTLGLHVPCERGAQRFTEGGAVVAASTGVGIVRIWGDPLDFLQTPDERLVSLTTPALAQTIRERVSEWWDKLTFLAVGHFRNSDSLTEAAWAGIVVARINSPLAKFAQLRQTPSMPSPSRIGDGDKPRVAAGRGFTPCITLRLSKPRKAIRLSRLSELNRVIRLSKPRKSSSPMTRTQLRCPEGAVQKGRVGESQGGRLNL